MSGNCWVIFFDGYFVFNISNLDIIGVYLGILVLGGVSGSFLSYKFI